MKGGGANTVSREARKKAVLKEAVLPLKAFLLRLSIVFFVAVSVVLMILNRIQNPIVVNVRTAVIDGVIPSLTILSSPVEAFQSAKEFIATYALALQENKTLKEDNQRLLRLKQVALALESENRRLRELLRMLPQDKSHFLTARVVGDTGGPYSRSVLINSGEENKLKSGLIVTNTLGLVGRIIEVGTNSARVLLLTDINMRVPVITEKSRERAVLSGNNANMPLLNHLPDDSHIRLGERVLTSGDGEYFPSGIPVGEVEKIDGKLVTVRPFVDWSRLDYVTITQKDE
jgi:rod shape-determining protein MreC